MVEIQSPVTYLPREAIDGRAKAVLERHGLYALPVDPLAVATREQIAVYNVSFTDETLAGAISRHGHQTTIYLRQQDPPSRKRFTIAHELGHFFLHLAADGNQQFTDGENNLFRQPGKSRPVTSDDARREYQANLFAAALLMPSEKVVQLWQSTDSIREMSNLFGVSDLAMSIRLGQLGLLDDAGI